MSILTRNEILTRLASGHGYTAFAQMAGSAATTDTSNAAASGLANLRLQFNTIGTTFPTTLVGIAAPTGLATSLMLTYAEGNSLSQPGLLLCYLYLIGTCTLDTNAGNNFTHDAATFPILRTQFGVASQPVGLVPLIQVTTATTVTPAVFTLATEAAGAGYTNQNGAGVVGNLAFTMPAAATRVNSTYLMRLNYGDSAVQDINAIDVTTAASAGAAAIWGMEILGHIGAAGGVSNKLDGVTSGINMSDLRPGVATAGTATAYLCTLLWGNTNGGVDSSTTIMGVLNS